MAQLVIAEDDPKQAHLIRLYAESEGHTVRVVGDGRAALEEVRREQPDLLLLDVMLPRVDGHDVCRILRAESRVPIMMITARSAEDDILLGLDLGADDYIVKPYSPRQLMARVRALLRRADRPPLVEDVLTVGSLRIDTQRHTVTYGAASLTCTPSEFVILDAMAREPGRVFTREQLTTHLHGHGEYISHRTIDTHVMNIRRKLEGDADEPVELRTVFGVGYTLTA